MEKAEPERQDLGRATQDFGWLFIRGASGLNSQPILEGTVMYQDLNKFDPRLWLGFKNCFCLQFPI